MQKTLVFIQVEWIKLTNSWNYIIIIKLNKALCPCVVLCNINLLMFNQQNIRVLILYWFECQQWYPGSKTLKLCIIQSWKSKRFFISFLQIKEFYRKGIGSKLIDIKNTTAGKQHCKCSWEKICSVTIQFWLSKAWLFKLRSNPLEELYIKEWIFSAR